jgi:hypothetical protein
MRSAAILSFIFLAVALSSAQGAPASIEGWWRGSGIVTYGNGAHNVQCRVRYTRLTAKSFAGVVPMRDGERPLRADRARGECRRQSLHRLGAEPAGKSKRQGFARPARQSPFGDGDEPSGIGSADLGKAWLSS